MERGASEDVPVLIVGGSLVGLAAALFLRWHGVHVLAVERHAGTAINARAGHFHLAESGTLFLDEIGNLPLGLQAKLLRVLESRQLRAVGSGQPTSIDVRFIAATNHDLHARVTEGQFRSAEALHRSRLMRISGGLQ